jgi:uncharacterized protein
MAHIDIKSDIELDEPMLVEGLPGVGLVGKIAADHLVEHFEMEYYAACYCEGLPRGATYEAGKRAIRPPVRLYADEDRDLLVLQSDVPVSPRAAPEFAGCLTGWFAAENVTPICLSGRPEEKEDVPELYGIGSDAMETRLDELGIQPPDEHGMVSGPTGAILSEATQDGVDAVGLIVQANPQFPDPEAARILLTEGIEPLAEIEVDTEQLVEQAEQIAEAREKLAERMQQATEESSQAQPVGMYQ